MLRKSLHVLWWFRWPLIGSVCVLLILYLVMQPRPMAMYQDVDGLSRFGYSTGSFKISPSGRYLAAMHSTTGHLHLFDLLKSEKVFDVHCFRACWGFNQDDGLVFLSSSWPQEGIEHLDLKHWQPGQSKPFVVHSRLIFPTDQEGRRQGLSPISPGGLSDHENGTVQGILSPGASLWFVPRVEADHMCFDVIVAVTGKVKYRAEYLNGLIKKGSTDRSLYAHISGDSNWLITQLCDADADSINLTVHDLNTGKPLKLAMQYQGAEPWRIATFSGKDVYGLSHHEGVAYLHHLTENAYQKVLLKETVPDSVKSAKAPYFTVMHAEIVQLKHSVQSRSRLIYGWSHTKSTAFGTGLGMVPNVAGSHYAVQDLQSGKLIQHGTLYTGDEVVGESSFDNNPAKLCCFLPDQGLLFLESPPRRQPWQTKLEDWRSKNAPWCFPLFPKVDRYRHIDGQNGSTIAQFSLHDPGAFLHASYAADGKNLMLVTDEEQGIVVRQYQFPLRLPWLIILGWVVLVFLSLALLQTVLAAWRNKRKLTTKA